MSGTVSGGGDAGGRGLAEAAYCDALGRDADPDASAAWQRALAQGGAKPASLRSGIAHSAEAAGDVEVLYAGVLGRPAGDAEVAACEDALAGDATLSSLRASATRSSERL